MSIEHSIPCLTSVIVRSNVAKQKKPQANKQADKRHGKNEQEMPQSLIWWSLTFDAVNILMDHTLEIFY